MPRPTRTAYLSPRPGGAVSSLEEKRRLRLTLTPGPAMLPDVDYDAYQQMHRRAGMSSWSAALTYIEEREGVSLAGAHRSPFGRNIVVLASDAVVKLVPPFWAHMWANEHAALEYVHGRLPVATPRLCGSGRVGAWGYIVMARLRGRTLGRRAEFLEPVLRVQAAELQGRLVRDIAALDPRPLLRWDWSALLAEDRAALPRHLAALPRALAKTALGYVDDAGELGEGETMLHGDLASTNLLREEGGGFSLVDWSDASVGPRDHEFISPLMHQFRGRPEELERFWRGYGPVEAPEWTAHGIMARSILKYGALMPKYLADLPGRMPATWHEAARRFTRLT